MKKMGLLLALICPSLAMGQVAAGTSFVNSTSSTNKTCTVTMTSVDANSVVLFSEYVDDDGTTTFNTPTATGLTFAQIGSTLHTAGNFYELVWRAYTTSSLGSTVVTGTWNTTNADWVCSAVDFTGTAGTAGSNGSDAIGGTNTATGTATTVTVSVTSTSHDQSKYYGAIVGATSVNATLTKGANYTNLTAGTFNSNFITALTEISTSAVSPAATTAVDGTATGAGTHWGIVGIELLKATGAGAVRRRGQVIQSQ